MEGMYLHCRRCLEEKPSDVSAREFQEIEAILLEDGRLCIWCIRHEMPVGTFHIVEGEGIMARGCAKCQSGIPHEHGGGE